MSVATAGAATCSHASHEARADLRPTGFDQAQDRGIYVAKSWPRPATPCDLVPRWEGEFNSFDDWVNFATPRLTCASDGKGRLIPAICVDALGRRCNIGGDFMRARDEGTFPVRYFWDCWSSEQSHEA